MPELPEVETIAKQLNRVLMGQVVASVKVLREKSSPGDLTPLVGKRVRAVGRKAKNIYITFENDEVVLVVHLKMTGQLIYHCTSEVKEPKRIVGGHPSVDWVGELPSKHTRIVIGFENGAFLFFNDQRVFGWMKLASQSLFNKQLAIMPPDVIDPEFTVEYLAKQLKRSGRAVKLVILDQQMMGGMGNIYANDALWWARVKPIKPANKLRKKEVVALHAAMVKVLQRGIEAGGATISDYRQTDGMGGSYQDETPTYMREGEACLREGCEGVIEKIKVGGRGAYWCVRCQR